MREVRRHEHNIEGRVFIDRPLRGKRHGPGRFAKAAVRERARIAAHFRLSSPDTTEGENADG